VHSIDALRSDSKISAGDVVVVGDRADAQRQSIELGATLIVISNGAPPDEEIRELARSRGVSIVISPLDSYLTSRMITLAAPCEAMIDREPLTVGLDDLISDIAEKVKDVHYRAAIAVDSARRPIGLITRSDLVSPPPRRVILVDHAEQAQSVHGVEQAEIVEILDHHHIGSIETRIPVTATFDPVGSTSTLVVERFRANGYEPSTPTATMLLCAVLSDTVLLNSPTTTDRDHAVVAYLEQMLGIDAQSFGREMFEATSDVSGVPAAEIVTRDAKEYELPSGETVSIAQIETVGQRLLEREGDLRDAISEVRRRNGYLVAALMITDILAGDTELIACGDEAAIERAFGEADGTGTIKLPGVMSRKKQVAPMVLGAF
jgi:manganese-dependent inorganic pyrophosphatase